MPLTYKFFTKFNSQISFLCQISNNLYNQANFIIKQELKNSHKWIRYKELNDIMKEIKNLEGEINYRLLKVQTSQQILRILDKNWNSYFKSLKQYKKS